MRRLVFLLALASALPAQAADPSLAAYSADGSRLLWWLQLTDTHIDTFLSASEEDRLRWAVSEGVTSIQPDFVVVTGDATDGTSGILYSGANQAEWDLYRSIVDAAGLNDPDYFFDLPGNHDAYSDAGLALFRQNSVQGSATGRTQAEWRLDRPWGSTCFVGVATPQEGGQPWPMDPTELTAAELAETETFLVGNPECRVTVAFGHHDAREVDGAEGFRALCQAHGIGHYVHGHSHDYVLSYDGNPPLVLRTDSLGQGSDHQVTVFALDHDTVSWESVPAADPWPLVVVTAPARGRFQTGSSWGNPEYLELPFAPTVPRTCAQAPVRALLFDATPVTTASFRLDDGDWHPLSQRQDVPAQWRGAFDATALQAGWHALTVQATGSKQRSFVVQVRLVDAPCEVGDEDPDGVPGAEPGPEAAGEAVPEAVVEVVAEAVAEVVAEVPAPDAGAETVAIDAGMEELNTPDAATEAIGPSKDANGTSPDLGTRSDTDDHVAADAPDGPALPDTGGGGSSCAVRASIPPGGGGTALALLGAGLAVVLARRRTGRRSGVTEA